MHEKSKIVENGRCAASFMGLRGRYHGRKDGMQVFWSVKVDNM